ncbi:NAD+ synthase [bacterium]|nr:NAD+ synthase [bacterium]
MITLPKLDFAEIEKKLTSFLVTEIEKTGQKKAVLGLSGGLDSALVAALAARALGKENVTGILMPYKTSSAKSIEDALKVVENTGINSLKIEISSVVDTFAANNMTIPDFSRKGRLGNIMARTRMITLFDFSAANGAIVLGTGNKSEIELGYFTMFGDGASALNPIGSLYKTDIFEFARFLGLPASVIEKAPSADLFEGQTDEGEIGYSYQTMDPVIHAISDLGMNEEEIVREGFDEKLVTFVSRRINSMKYKRKVPIIAKI